MRGARDSAAGDGLVPFPVPAELARVRAEYDWEAALPARADSWSWRVRQRMKRLADIILSAVALLLLSPIFLALALAVRLTSRGPIFYEWRVLGRHGRPFLGYKFRTMVENADELKDELRNVNEMIGPVFKMQNDPRMTRLGRWLRKYSLDELPQLWSVFKGDMSLVGPRPPSPDEFMAFQPWQRAKLAVTPGVTCIWQVEGRAKIRDFDRWVALDLEYIRDWSLWLDFKILVRTIPAVVRGDGAY